MNTNLHITKNFWEYAVHSRSYKAMSNTLRLCAKCLIFMRISLLYRISLFAGLSVGTSLCLLSFYNCCRVRGKLSTKWLFRFASWRENIQMEITAFVTELELELCNYFYSPCSQLFKSLSYIHSISAYQKAPTAQQANNKIWNVLPRVDIRLKKEHEIPARTVFFGPYSKDDFAELLNSRLWPNMRHPQWPFYWIRINCFGHISIIAAGSCWSSSWTGSKQKRVPKTMSLDFWWHASSAARVKAERTFSFLLLFAF